MATFPAPAYLLATRYSLRTDFSKDIRGNDQERNLRGRDEVIKTIFLFPKFWWLEKDLGPGKEGMFYLIFETTIEMPALTKFTATPDIGNSDYTTINLYEREEHRTEERINGDTETSIT